MKTMIDAARKSNPNTVVMNIGDTFHGGVEAFYSLGNAVTDPLNALGIDVGVFGNWDYTPSFTRARYRRIVGLEGDVVQATIPGFNNPVPQIGFIGLISDIVEEMHPLLAEGRDFAFGLEEGKDLIIKHACDLRNRAQTLLMLMSELGIQKDSSSESLTDMKSNGGRQCKRGQPELPPFALARASHQRPPGVRPYSSLPSVGRPSLVYGGRLRLRSELPR